MGRDPQRRGEGVGTAAGLEDTVVVLPAYNEAVSLPRLLRRLAAERGAAVRVLVIDDGSTDGTAAAAERLAAELPGLTVLRHPGNRGLGGALRTGWQAALAAGLPDDGAVVTMDADDTHDPAVIAQLLQLLRQGHDVAIASRFARGGGEVGLSPARRALSLGARVFLSLVRHIPGVSDYTCGYRAYRAGALRQAFAVYGPDGLITAPGFACTAEVLLKLAALGARCAEAPLVLHYEQKAGRSKMRILRTLVGYAHVLSATRRARGTA